MSVYPAATGLHLRLEAALALVCAVSGPDAGGRFTVQYPPGATDAQKAQGDAIAAAWPTNDWRTRPLYAIRADVQALSVGQMNNVWGDLSAAAGAVPRKYLGDPGPNAAALFVFDHVLYVIGGTAAQVKAAQISITAEYVQDNPYYLVQPAFDSSVNVWGWEAAS